jgi:phosphate transport system protein
MQVGEKILPRIHFHQQLAELKDKLLAMAALSQQAVESAVEAYLRRDAGICQYVRENETAINAAQREVDEMAYELLAKEQPMAICASSSLSSRSMATSSGSATRL